MARAPTSLLLLIDRRNRLEGELARLEVLKRDAALLHRHVKRSLEEVDSLLDRHHIELDWSVLEAKITYAKGPFDYGVLTAQLLRALKNAPEAGMTSLQIAEAIHSDWPEALPRPANRSDFMFRLRKRLNNLRAEGMLLSPHVGDGRVTSTTWIINGRRWLPSDQE